jgi:predicted nucleic acid-binding protein
VLAEMISTLARRLHEKRRAADLDELLVQIMTRCPPERITWILPDVPALYVETMENVRAFGGELNFNDVLIALSCRNRGIAHIASFDRDFDRLPRLQRVAHPSDL